MAKTETRPWNAADHLNTEADVVAYLDAAFEDGDPALIAAALGDVARTRGSPESPPRRDSEERASTKRCLLAAIRSSRP